LAKSVNAAFDELLAWIRPTETETDAAASHRASIEACLKNNLGMTSMFRAGSFGHGTSVSGYSDVDYFAVFPGDKLKLDSSATLRILRETLETRFPNTGVYVSSPAVAVPFGKKAWERHEITPADLVDATKAYRIYDIPDRAGGWMRSSPSGHNAYTNTQNDRLDKKAKQVIRLIKLWNYQLSVGLRSIYVELRVAEYLTGETTVLYPYDVYRALRHLQVKALAGMQDPLGLSGYIYPCTDAVKPAALSKLDTAVTRAANALEAEKAGKTADALDWWGKVFGGYFPAYA
jgi:hypothetical protein